jgi:glycosyltransferase involved in cell wall biosynthesis
VRVGIDIGKALGPLDGVCRYARGLLAGLMALGGDDEYRLYPLFAPVPRQSFAELFPRAPANFRLMERPAPAPGEVDVFHCTTAAVPIGAAMPLVFTLFDLTFLSHPAAHLLGNRLHCLRGLARALARGARLTAISESTREESQRLLGVAAQDVRVVYPGVEARFRPAAPERVTDLRARLGLTEPYVLTVGTLEPRKNLAGLLAAFAALPEAQGRTLRLAVAGGAGWLDHDPLQLATELGVADRVAWLGAVPDDDLPALYSGAEVFAYPSFFEGFGLPPLEAMACGAPVLVADAGALPEVVGEAATRVDPASVPAIRDGLAALLGDPARRRVLAAAGRARAAAFTWERTARDTREIYAAAAARRAA